MTEAELLQSAQAVYSNLNEVMATAITLISGYLVAAYLAGKDMTSSQVALINTLYLLILAMMLGGVVSLGLQGGEMATLALAKTAERTVAPNPLFPIFIAAVLGFCAIATLKFMWDIRHPKKE